jgi:glutathione S-transferase
MENKMSQLTLYVDAQYTSPWAMAVFVMLKEKQLPFTLQTVDLNTGAQHTAEFAGRSLTQRIPTLTHGDFSLSESTAICEYLEEQFPNTKRMLPADIHARARARQVQGFVRTDMAALRSERSTETIFFAPATTPLSKDAQAAADKLISFTEALLPNNADNLFGAWSIADTDLAVMLMRIINSGGKVPARIEAYAKKQWAHPAVKEWCAFPRTR